MGGGGVLPKVRFGLGEENWSLEILEGGILPKVGFGVWEENWSLEICVCVGGGGGGGSVPNFRIGCSCQFGQNILEAQLAFASQIVSHTTYVETNKIVQ